MNSQSLRDPHLAALVERIPDDVFEVASPRRRSLGAWMRRWRRALR